MSSHRLVRRSFPGLTVLLGLITGVSAVLHTIAVIGVAYSSRGGYDARLADLLWIGWTSLACGALMIGSYPALRRGSLSGYRVATGAAAIFLGGASLIAVVQPSFWTAVPLYGGYLLLAAWLWPRGISAGLDRRRVVGEHLPESSE